MADESIMGERISRIETRLDGIAHDVSVLKTDVGELKVQVSGLSQKVEHLGHRLDVTNDHMDARFDQVGESFQALTEQMDRGFAQVETNRREDQKLLSEILRNHGGRIAKLEGGSRR